MTVLAWQEMGLTDVDLAYIGVKNAAHRKALKMAAGGFVELMLQVEISGYFNFNSELVRKAPDGLRARYYVLCKCYFIFVRVLVDMHAYALVTRARSTFPYTCVHFFALLQDPLHGSPLSIFRVPFRIVFSAP